MTGERERLIFFAYSLAVGGGLGVFYDLFRIMRVALYGRRGAAKKYMIRLPGDERGVDAVLSFEQRQVFPTGPFFFTLVCDIIYCMFAAIAVTVLVFQFGSGVVRAFAISGVFLGAAVYYFTLGRAVISFSGAMISAVKRFLRFVFRFTLAPIIRLIRCALAYIKSAYGKRHRARLVRRQEKRLKRFKKKAERREKRKKIVPENENCGEI